MSNADRYRWQQRAYLALGGVLDASGNLDLPVAAWTVGPIGGLSARLDTVGLQPDQIRAAMAAWAAHLGADVTERETTAATYLRATFKVGDVGGVISVTVLPPLDDDA